MARNAAPSGVCANSNERVDAGARRGIRDEFPEIEDLVADDAAELGINDMVLQRG